jgi:hypothetical protein
MFALRSTIPAHHVSNRVSVTVIGEGREGDTAGILTALRPGYNDGSCYPGRLSFLMRSHELAYIGNQRRGCDRYERRRIDEPVTITTDGAPSLALHHPIRAYIRMVHMIIGRSG